MSVVPAESAGLFNWDGKQREWQAILRDERERILLGVNLRYILKLAVTHELAPDPGRLGEELAEFDPSRSYSAVLLPWGAAERLGANLYLDRYDLAANLDFQSLAAVVADLVPPRNAANWDFSFFRSGVDHAERKMKSFMITRPGPGDPFFRVFYHLYSIINDGRDAGTPEEAWRAAVDEVAERLSREAEFSGGGGFGGRARRELVREIAAIPALAANGLYHTVNWFADTGDFHAQIDLWAARWSENVWLEFTHYTQKAGRIEVTAELLLHPLAFPRDTVLTRLPPLMASTFLAYIAARENVPAAPVAEALSDPAPQPVAEPPPEEKPLTEKQLAEKPAVDVIIDESAFADQEKIQLLEDSIRQLRLVRDDTGRRLDAARDREKRLTMEVIAARARADRLQERYDQSLTASVAEPESELAPETLKLLIARDEIRAYLAALLERCTEEHPMVRQSRRDLSAIESLLAGQTTKPHPSNELAADAKRDGLLREWESASAAANGLEERRRRHHIEIDEALAALTSAERQLAELEASLSRFRQEIQKQREPAAPAITDAHIAHITVITPAPTPTPIENPESSSPIPPVPVFSDIPGRISLIRFLPNWEMPVKGLIAGLILGILWSLVRELLTFRLGNANEVGYLAAYPVLSILPGYDAKSLRNAAKSTRGELAVSRSGGAVFTPAPVELFEPQPASRRAKLAMFKRRPRILAWVFGFLILAGGVIMHFSFSSGIAQPEVAFRGELAPPPATAYDLLDPENEDGDWGDEP